MNFSRLRLSVGFAVVLGIATATAGLAQYGANPEAPLPPATPGTGLQRPPAPRQTGPRARGQRLAGARRLGYADPAAVHDA